MEHACERVDPLRKARPWHDDVLADEEVNAPVPYRRKRREGRPDPLFVLNVVWLEQALCAHFEDDLRSTHEQRLL
jgi:hypothetical protein